MLGGESNKNSFVPQEIAHRFYAIVNELKKIVMKEASPPAPVMTTPTNGSGNLVDEFEEAFQVKTIVIHCRHTTKISNTKFDVRF